MFTINLIMNEGRRFESLTKGATMKDICDTSVIRRVRMIQLAFLSDCDKLKLVSFRHGKEIRERILKNEQASKKWRKVIFWKIRANVLLERAVLWKRL